jgi:hypothetical protein
MSSNDTTDPASPLGPGAGQPERTQTEAARPDSGSDPEPGKGSSPDSGSGSSSGSGSGSGVGNAEPTRGTKEPPPDPPIGTPPPRG